MAHDTDDRVKSSRSPGVVYLSLEILKHILVRGELFDL